MKVEMEVTPTDVRVGDVITGFRKRGSTDWYGTSERYEVCRVTDRAVYRTDAVCGEDHYCDLIMDVILRVERDAEQLVVTSTATPSRKVPDWPLTCPKCGRGQSAVLLFNSYDCRHGCYGRKAPDTAAESWEFGLGGTRWRATRVKTLRPGERGWWMSEDCKRHGRGSDMDFGAFRADPQGFADLNWGSSPGWVETDEEHESAEKFPLKFEEVP